MLDASTVAKNLAMDDTLCRTVAETGQCFLRFWWGGPPAVVMGFSEQPDQVANQSECRRLVWNCLSEPRWGSVLQNSGVLNYSLVMPAPESLNPKRVFGMGTELIRSIIAGFGLAGTQEGTSDVASEQKDFRQCASPASQITPASRHPAGGLRL